MSNVPEGLIYAQIDQLNAIQDYEPGQRCLRLIGVAARSFEQQTFNSGDGCRTFFVDVAWALVVSRMETELSSALRRLEERAEAFSEDWSPNEWIVLRYKRSPGVTEAYAYEIFANANPTYLDLVSLDVIEGPAVDASEPTETPADIVPQQIELHAFHVGQGMCALIRGQTDGYLFDVGAGTPIDRATYRTGLKSGNVPFVNDLQRMTQGLSVQAILSHPDSDHWRLLDWDHALCNAITGIFKPNGTAALAFKSPHVKLKVHALGSATVSLTDGTILFRTHRSKPAKSDRNGECLVVEAQVKGETALLPGDYVYERMATDGNPAINALAAATFSAVMVPHHGDSASANVVVAPSLPYRTPAFFSAGTHTGYGHPKASSLKAHSARNFTNIDQHTYTDILAHRLL